MTRGVALVGTGIVGIALGCLLELPHLVACGDGYVDDKAGEECDPEEPDSFAGACCEPTRCTLIEDKAECGVCGDRVLSARSLSLDAEGEAIDEECDTEDFGDRDCPMGGQLGCRPDCTIDDSECLPYCGDGEKQDDEECGETGGELDLSAMVPCAGDGGHDPIPAPNAFIPYGSGVATCVECSWERGQCSYCGNGTRDERIALDDDDESPTEWCDGDQFDSARLQENYGSSCDARLDQRPNVACAPGCYDFVEREDFATAPCCIARGGACPSADDGMRCCYAYERPGEDPCDDDNPVLPPKCR